MSTHNLPYPLSDNRSYVPSHSNRLQSDALYAHQDLQYKTTVFKQPEYRFHASPASRSGGAPLHAFSGTYGTQSDFDARLHATGAYGGPSSEYFSSSVFDDALIMSQASKRTIRLLSISTSYLRQMTLITARPNTAYLANPNDTLPHLPPHPLTLLLLFLSLYHHRSLLSPPTRFRLARARRRQSVKRSLELNSLPTSHSLRRVNFAPECTSLAFSGKLVVLFSRIQSPNEEKSRRSHRLLRDSRSRKIRCDGAKPICHNCSRRATTPVGGAVECTYDSAPKRRGPDRHPGARQRLLSHDTADGGKIRKRRRRQPEPSSGNDLVDTVNSLTQVDTTDGPDQNAMRIDAIAGISSAAESHVPTRSTGLSVLVEGLDVYGGQSHNTAYSLSNGGDSSHLTSSPQHFLPSLPHDATEPQQDVNDLPPSQVRHMVDYTRAHNLTD